MLGDTRLKRVAYLHVDQELRERLRDEALAPVLPPEPVADLSLAAFLEAHDCAGYAPPKSTVLLMTPSSARILVQFGMNASPFLAGKGAIRGLTPAPASARRMWKARPQLPSAAVRFPA